MKAKLSAAALVFALSSFPAAQAKPPTIPLECGKSSGAVAERQYLDAASGGGDTYSVKVTFIGKKPANAKVEAALRECLAVATKKDGTKDVLATAWLKARAGASDNDDEQLNAFDGMNFISYTAATKKVGVRGLQMTKK
jgi:hypothetical protein